MNIKDEALKLALEALEESLGYVEEEAENAQRLYGQYPTRQARIQGLKDDARKHMDAITAIREALAEHIPDAGKMVEQSTCKQALQVEQPAQQQEPVAWMFQHEETGRTMCVDAQQVEWDFEKSNPRLKKIAPLYKD